MTFNPLNRLSSSKRRRGTGRDLTTQAVVLRAFNSGDEKALERLASLDSRELPTGGFLLAEVEGTVLAAAPLHADAAPLSDPFRRSVGLLDLLSVRARQLAVTV